MTTAPVRTLALGGRRYPVVLPRLDDARLHLAAVIISIHVLGQLALGFAVSVPQILAAIVASGLIEVVVTLRRSGRLVWPASALLTGSGVALILRVNGTEPGDHWTWQGWHLFAAVAAGSLLSKYVVRRGDTHLFNPSNAGLVAAFLLLGSSRVEPLDFWWGPLDAWMMLAYAIIVVGGFAITARLALTHMAITFWVVLAAGLGVLSASGHCMTTAWSLGPVCGTHFWWVVVTSPEVAIFLFFMITDPRTIPAARAARMAFAAAVAVLAALLIAPQTIEFGAKVGLLAGLVVMSPWRSVFDRLLPEPQPGTEPARTLIDRLGSGASPARVFARGALAGSALVLVATAIVAAGSAARPSDQALPPGAPSPTVAVDPAALPPVTMDAEVERVAGGLADDGGVGLATLLVGHLAVERQAMEQGDPALLPSVDQGRRLAAMEDRIDAASADGQRVVDHYLLDDLHVRVMFSEGSQAGPSLAFDATGSVVSVVSQAGGAELERRTEPLGVTFVVRPVGDERWAIVDALPLETSAESPGTG